MIIVEEILLCAQNDKNNGFPLRLKPDLRFCGNDNLFVRAVGITLTAFFICTDLSSAFHGIFESFNYGLACRLQGKRPNFSLLVFFLWAFAVRIG